MITDYQWIDDNSQLDILISCINSTDEIAFDSEFERINTFFPKPALFQLKIKGQYFLIDMTKVSNYELLLPLLDNIILHSGSEDLEILYNYNQQLPSKIFDTQIVASLCGYGLHFSYQNIVKEILGVELSKAHSRSDWMQRPLSSAQIQYALEDVVYLPELKEILSTKLQQLGREKWYECLIQQKINAVINSDHVHKTFLKLATASKKLNQSQQKLLYALLSWREKLAIKRDKPRPWILKNHEILNIVLKQPKTSAQLITDIGLYHKFVEYNGKSIFALYDSSQQIDPEQLPMFKALTPQQGVELTALKKELVNKCDKINIPAALVINTSDLKSLVAAGQNLSNISMWNLINA
ncbi:MAG: HRDC domain-containing protein [Proteobacteria bacterium]|nr:HRDC domain-containing protein [Pseudomonadota bacterium]